MGSKALEVFLKLFLFYIFVIQMDKMTIIPVNEILPENYMCEFTFLLLLMFILIDESNYINLNKKMLVIFKSIDADPSAYLSQQTINMIKNGEDRKALKAIKKETGFSLKDSKDIFMKVKWNLAKNSS